MTPQTAVLDVFIGGDGDAWRLYFAPTSWKPGFIGQFERTVYMPTIYPVGRPDVGDLDRFMWDRDAPFERRPTAGGGVEIQARARSAMALAEWLRHLAQQAP